jgi:hypothetical protein
MNFTQALNIQDPEFESILTIMKLKRGNDEIESHRNLLMTINLLLDYYLTRDDTELRVPILYVPICTNMAQVLSEEFVTIKLGLFSESDWRNTIYQRIKRTTCLVIPSDAVTRKLVDLCRENFYYERDLAKELKNRENDIRHSGKTLIFDDYLKRQYDEYILANKSYNKKKVNKYWYLSKFIKGDQSKPADSSCPLSLITTDDGDKFYDEITQAQERIENIVIFPFKSADGRFDDFCSDVFQMSYLEDYISTGVGLRNVFFFCFSRKPYRLRRIKDFKDRIKTILKLTDDDVFDFISFTYKESCILFNYSDTKRNTISVGKIENEIQSDYESMFDGIIARLDRFVCRRNEAALCVTDDMIDYYKSKLSEESEAENAILDEILKINGQLWKEDNLDVILTHFVKEQNVHVILGNDIDFQLKDGIDRMLKSMYGAKSVSFSQFDQLKGRKKADGIYMNDITAQRIIVFSFRCDYTMSMFHRYPNTFDPFCINPDQLVLGIINFFYLRQYVEWGKYRYIRATKDILKSEFRSASMKLVTEDVRKPAKKYVEDSYDEESDRNSAPRAQQMVIVEYENGRHSYFRSEWMLYKISNQLNSCTLSDLFDNYNGMTGEILAQPMSALVKKVYDKYVESERDKDTREEKYFKKRTEYNLSADEIASDVQLWKILLQRRIDADGAASVYNSVMANSFKRWANPDYGIPRARKVQKFLVENYLNIRPPYLNLIRRIKERTKSDTENIKLSIRHFLNICLFNDATNTFKSLSDETKDLLNIGTESDIEDIVAMVKSNIKLEKIKSIHQ